MKRNILNYNLLLLLFITLFSACSKDAQRQDQGGPYQVTGLIKPDSTLVIDTLMLYADSHDTLVVDTFRLDAEHKFVRQLHTAGLDELYLMGKEGELCRFYAAQGMQVDFSMTMGDSGLEPRFEYTDTDSINAWLQEMDSLFVTDRERRRHDIMDSLVALPDSSIRVTLLLRNHLPEFQDSVYVRRLLGGMPVSAKPDWLMKSMDLILNENSEGKIRSRRWSTAAFDIKNDTVEFNLGDSRTDYLLVCFWADYSQASIDSLKMLSKLLKDKFSDRRLQLMSCCLHVSDSARWDSILNKIPGKHTWVKGGMSDPRIKSWGIHKVPSVALLDMYNNQQQKNVWGSSLQSAIERLPKKQKDK